MTSSAQSRWLVGDSSSAVLVDWSLLGECFRPTVLPPVERLRDESRSWQHRNTRDSVSLNAWKYTQALKVEKAEKSAPSADMYAAVQ